MGLVRFYSNAAYFGAVLELGSKLSVTVSKTMYGADQAKLADAGTLVNRDLLNSLIAQNLDCVLDDVLSVEGGVDQANIAKALRFRFLEDPRFRRLTGLVDIQPILSALQDLPLPEPLAFKLTLARELRPYLYEHSLDVAVVAAYLQAHATAQPSALVTALAAGLFHDLGMLFVPAHILASTQPMSDADGKQIYAHPISGALVVERCAGVPLVVSAAILEHHERLDGSGYPHSLVAQEISDLGKILMLADVTAALLQHSTTALSGISLRMQRSKFDPNLLEPANKIFAPVAGPGDANQSIDLNDLAQQLNAVAEVVALWNDTFREASATFAKAPGGKLLWLIQDRITRLERTLLEAGFVYSQLNEFSHLTMMDKTSVAEIHELVAEALWQLKDIAREVRRHWDAEAHTETDLLPIFGWIKFAEAQLGQLSTATG